MASCQPTFTSIADKNPLSQTGAVSQTINYQTQLNIAQSFLWEAFSIRYLIHPLTQ
jgi:hypothetical protein